MREWFALLKPNPWLTKNLIMAAILIGVGVGSFCWGRHHASANANPPGTSDVLGNGPSAINGTRVVAYVNNQPVFREELGEYLIARFGADRLEFLVNSKIVEMECRKHNITVTDADVNARFRHELQVFGGGSLPLTEENFVNNILKRFGKTLFEWKEDVIRPKLMMEALVRNTIKITEQDVRDGFEARYGPKVECRMIVIDNKERATVQPLWDEVHKSPQAFIERAKHQAIPSLANVEGRVPPIHKHFGDKALEDTAFRLKPGDVSGPIQLQDKSWVILLCERHVPENKLVRLEDERMKVEREVEELQIAQQIPERFKKMREAAAPQFILRNESSPVSMRTEPMPTLALPPGQATTQLPPKTPLPAPNIAAPSLTPGK